MNNCYILYSCMYYVVIVSLQIAKGVQSVTNSYSNWIHQTGDDSAILNFCGCHQNPNSPNTIGGNAWTGREFWAIASKRKGIKWSALSTAWSGLWNLAVEGGDLIVTAQYGYLWPINDLECRARRLNCKKGLTCLEAGMPETDGLLARE